MNLVAWFLSMVYPLCGTAGAAGIAPPGVVDFGHLRLLGHSEVLVAPSGFAPKPEIVAPVFAMPPAQLYAELQDVAALQPRTFPLDAEPRALQAAWVVRTALGNFPDMIEIAVLPEPDGKSSFIFYSHALYGASDYGVNRKHAIRWLKDLNMKVAE
jgi:uncharacterized protein (DUF1499 family)